MLQTLKLLLPALIPSWRFFDTIAPSPRIEFSLLENMDDMANHWQKFRPTPERLSIGHMLRNIFWSPRWNESLFLVSCAERLMDEPTDHSAEEIFRCIKVDLHREFKTTRYIQFRLVFLSRNGVELERHVTFTSPMRSLESINS